MGISRRALTILGLTGITATSAGYWHLRTPKTILESRSSDQVEQYSFSLESESYVETGRNRSGGFVIYDAETLDIHIAEVPWLDHVDSNKLPPGKYNVSTLGYMPDIKTAPLYYLRQLGQDVKNDNISIETITEDQVEYAEYFDKMITEEERIYLIAPLMEEFTMVQESGGRNVINPPTEPINNRSGVRGNGHFELEYQLRLTKKILDPMISNANGRIKQQYRSMWDEFEQLMAAHKVSVYLNLLLDDDSIVSDILGKLTNTPTINSINYAIDSAGIDPNLYFYTNRAAVSNNQAIVPVGLRMLLSSDIPTIDKDTEIFTNTINVPAVLTPPQSNTKYDYLSRLDYNYRQWRVDYEDIRSGILNSLEDSIDSL